MKGKANIPQGYKDSPLGIIPEEWEVKRLGELGEVRMCKRILKRQTALKGDIPFYKIGTFGGTPDAYISKELYNEYTSKFSFPKVGDVLISAAGTIGRTVIYDGTPSYFQDSNIVWLDNDNRLLVNKYLFYFYSTINWVTDTGTIPRVYNNALKSIQIAVPPIKEQVEIISIINLWDTAIKKQSELIDKLTLRKQALMQQLLTGKKRLPGFSGEWKRIKLGDIAKLNTSTIATSIINPKAYLGTENMLPDGKGFIPFEKNIVYSQVREYRKGDVLLSNIRPYLRKIWLSNQDGGCSTDIHVIRKTNLANVDTSFLYYSLSLDYFFEYVMSSAKGSKMPRGDAKVLMKYPMEVPPYSEQIAIRTVFEVCDKEIELANNKLARLQSQKRGLMQQLLTGKKRIL